MLSKIREIVLLQCKPGKTQFHLTKKIMDNFQEILTDSKKCGDEFQLFGIEVNFNISIFVEFILQNSLL